MAERTGRRARWTTALVVAPGAAAMFGATTFWALQGAPVPAAKPAAPAYVTNTKTGLPAPSPSVVALQRTAVQNQQQLVAMAAQLRKLRAELSGFTAPAGSAAAVAGAGTGAGGPGPGVQVSTLAAPPVAANPAPAAPPPVQTTTGGSGK